MGKGRMSENRMKFRQERSKKDEGKVKTGKRQAYKAGI